MHQSDARNRRAAALETARARPVPRVWDDPFLPDTPLSDENRMIRDMHGGTGMSGTYGIIHHVMTPEAAKTHEGTDDVHARMLNRGQTGLQAVL